MELKINNQTKQFTTDSLSVLDLEILKTKRNCRINNTVIPKSDWNSHHIQETDDILIISATQGG
jgi:sulfur carrier protein